MNKPRRISEDELKAIRQLAVSRMLPADIERTLKEADKDWRVTLPTIRDIWKEVNPTDDSGPWSSMDAMSQGDALIVLAVLRDVHRWSQGRINGFTRNEAAAITKVSWVWDSKSAKGVSFKEAIERSAPDLRHVYLWALAREYVRRREDPASLDLMIALGYDEYQSARQQGRIESPHFDVMRQFGDLLGLGGAK